MSQDIAGKQGSKRDKYTLHACGECQRRKVKCSGEPVCSSCQTRGSDCRYEEGAQRGPKPRARSHREFAVGEISSPESVATKRRKSRSTFRDQLARLQEKVDALFEGQELNSRNPADTQVSHDSLSASFLTFPDGVNTDRSMNSLLNVMPSSLQSDPYNPRRIFQDTDIFHAQSPPSNTIALSSQIDALRKLGTNARRARLCFEETAEMQLKVQLPAPSTLWSRTTTFFAEYGCYFPCLHENRVRDQLSATLTVIGYDECHTEVSVRADQCQIIAILCNMLAYAESVTQSPANSEPHPGALRYCEGLKLMELFGKLHDNSLQTTIYHTIAASYLLELGMLQMAFQSIFKASQIALCIALNNQERWPNDRRDEELACPQSLWWTIFFLDKRIAQKSGIAYSVRQSECAAQKLFGADGILDCSPHHELLRSMIAFSQLWTDIWDTFFSPQATKEDAWEDMQLTDIKIILAYRRLPSRLRWRSQRINIYLNDGDNERQIRRRLIVFLRFTFLRLSIRHKPILPSDQDRERRESCFFLCIAMIEAVRTYTNTFGCHKPSGHILTSALVESLYCIISEQQQSDPVVSHHTLERANSYASRLLHRLSLTITSASRACDALQDVLSSFDDSSDVPCLLDDPILSVKDNITGATDSLSNEVWKTTSEAAGQEYDPESAHPQRRDTHIISPLDMVDGLEDPFNNMGGELDWNSLLKIFPPEHLS